MPSFPLPRFLEQAREHREHAANLGRALAEQPSVDLAERKIVHDPSDSLTLRGIPAVGRGVAGVIRGTQPEQAVSSWEAPAAGAPGARGGRAPQGD